MFAEFMKWLQGMGVAGLMVIYEFVRDYPTDGMWWKAAALMVMVRFFGWLVSKFD